MAGNSAAAGKAVQEADAFAQAHARLVQDSAIQFDLPRYRPPRMPDWLQGLFDMFAAMGPLLHWIFVLALIIAAVALAYAVGVAAARYYRQRSAGADTVEDSWRPEEGPARALLAEADALAASGRFAEAARLLLWRSLEDIEARRPNLLKPALTSRDISRAEGLPANARSAFVVIARAVEAGLFARREVDSASWRECRAAYESFAFSGAWA